MRKELDHRPLVVAVIGLLIGVTAHDHPLNLLFLIPVAVAVRSVKGRLLATAVFIAGLLACKPPLTIDPSQAPAEIEGVVSSRPRPTSFGAQSCTLSTDYGHVLVRYDGDIKLALGDRVRVRGALSPGEGGVVFKQPSLEAFRVAKLAQGPPWVRWSDAWRDSFCSFAESNLKPSEAALLEATFFSSPELLAKESRGDFQASNTMHLVTAAGLHVLLIALAIQAVMGWLPVPRWVQMLLLVGALLLFVAASGFHSSTLRASLFALVVRSSYLFRREPDVPSAVSAAAIVMLLLDPGEAGQVGFQLTLVSAFAFALFMRSDRGAAKSAFEKIRRSGFRAFRLAFIATLATAPILAQTQHALLGDSILASLLAAFVLPAILGLSFLLHGLSFVAAPSAGWLLGALVAPLLSWMEGVTSFFAQAPILRLEMPYFSGYWLIPLYGCALATWRPNVRTA